jgi:L-fuconolactonase
MNIDSHQHFWLYDDKEYGWIGDDMKILKKNYLPEDFHLLLHKSGFEGCLVVEARQSLEESRWLLHLADSNDFIKGVVGWVDLCSRDVKRQLLEFASHPKFVGVRHVIHDERDDNFILRDDFMNGIQGLKEYELVYEILIFPRHLKNTIRFVERFHDQKFVLDHIGKPNIRSHNISPWREDIRELASFPNVFCKLSGMVTEADWKVWKENDFKEYLDILVEAFGTERLMIGSDWPVCLLAGNYSDIMKIVPNYFSKFTETENNNIMGLNAMRVYNIPSK